MATCQGKVSLTFGDRKDLQEYGQGKLEKLNNSNVEREGESWSLKVPTSQRLTACRRS